MKLGIISILGMLVLLIASSGCISDSTSNSTQQFQKDIEIGGASYDYYAQDGSGGGGCWLRNKGQITYTKVKINLEVFDKEGNSIANQTIVVGKMGPGEEINWATPEGYAPLSNGASARATVIEATPSQ